MQLQTEQTGPFHTVTAGDREGRPLVLLIHGLGATSALWKESMPCLQTGGYFPVAMDIRGHGRSTVPDWLYTVEDHADSMMELVRHYGAEEVHLVGNSLGALIAFSFAARFPEVAASIVTIGCPAWASPRERRDWLRLRSVLVDLKTGTPAPSAPLKESDAGLEMQRSRTEMGVWLMNSIWATSTFDLMGVLGQVRCPSLVLYGEDDWLKDTGRNLLGGPIETSEIVSGAGHHAPLDQPEVIGARVTTWLNSLKERGTKE